MWPQLLLLSNGVLALSSGRPGLGLWVSADGSGDSWVFTNVAKEHNRHFAPPSPLAFAGGKWQLSFCPSPPHTLAPVPAPDTAAHAMGV